MRQTATRRRPFLKWAGNKYPIMDRILAMLPEGSRLIEPFAGSAAVFLNSEFDRYLLADINADVIDLYKILKRDGQAFVNACAPLFSARSNRPRFYYRARDEFNECADPERRAALFIYLNRHGYNGLCRYNRDGGFNVPFGRFKRPYFPAREMLDFAAKARASRAVFRRWDFAHTIAQAAPGDVIYCDPPYVPLSASANFTAYSAAGFGLDQQHALAELAGQAARRGVPVLISNHNTKATRDAYSAAHVKRFKVRRNISCNAQRREPARELLAMFQ